MAKNVYTEHNMMKVKKMPNHKFPDAFNAGEKE